MKIGFILSYAAFSSTNGIRSQAISWKNGLEKLNHEVALINMWEDNQWCQYDAIVIFGFSVYSCDFINILSTVHKNILVAPILDPNYSILALKIYSRWGNRKLRLTNPYYSLRQVKDKVRAFLIRSNFEKAYLIGGFGIPKEKCHIVPLSCGISKPKELFEKEKFCLHISLLCDERKNVKRLIKASKKYGFRLVLAGKLRNQKEKKLLNTWIDSADNIEYRGYVSHEEKMELYTKAKVFALPSTNEGVGIVALEAAAMGCDIVITNLGGPKEYYSNMATVINPYNVDEIGKAICKALDTKSFQPNLAEYINKNYSIDTISRHLEQILFHEEK